VTSALDQVCETSLRELFGIRVQGKPMGRGMRKTGRERKTPLIFAGGIKNIQWWVGFVTSKGGVIGFSARTLVDTERRKKARNHAANWGRDKKKKHGECLVKKEMQLEHFTHSNGHEKR